MSARLEQSDKLIKPDLNLEIRLFLSHHDDLYVEADRTRGGLSSLPNRDDERIIPPRRGPATRFTTNGPRAGPRTMTANQDAQPPEPKWSPEARTWVSLLLFAHLFAVFVAMITYTRPSPLEERLHGLFEPYLRNLHLTAFPISYPFARYYLTHAGPGDVDFSVEVDVQRAEGEAETVTLPAADMQPLVRFRRYQALADATGTLASSEFGDDTVASILPKVIAASVLRRHQADGGVVRVLAHGSPELEDMANLATLAEAARQNVSNVYEAQAIVSPQSVELLRKSTTLEVAPVERGSRRRSPSTRQTPSQQPAETQP